MVKQIKKNTLRYPAELERFTTLAPDSNINFSSINYLFNSTFCEQFVMLCENILTTHNF